MTSSIRLVLSALPAAGVTVLLMLLMSALIADRPVDDAARGLQGDIRFQAIEAPPPQPRTTPRAIPERPAAPPGLPGTGEGRVKVPPGTRFEVDPIDLPPVPAPGPNDCFAPAPPGLPGVELAARSMVAPLYPPKARMDGVEGHVVVEFTVRPDGSTERIVVLSAEPRRIFEQAALAAVQRWTFHPATRDGEAIAVRMQQRIDFVLAD